MTDRLVVVPVERILFALVLGICMVAGFTSVAYTSTTFAIKVRMNREYITSLGYYALLIPIGGFLYFAYETVHLALVANGG